jgi:hypothetical protein
VGRAKQSEEEEEEEEEEDAEEEEWSCREAADGIPEWPVGRSGIPSWAFWNAR